MVDGGVREGKGQEMNLVLQRLTVESVKEKDKKWIQFHCD
jgi:hypothetical protein